VADNGVSPAKLAHQGGAGILVYLPDGTPAFLSVGGAGQALVVDESSPSGLAFGDAVGGGWQFIAEKTGSGNPATITFEAGTDFSAALGALRFDLTGVRATTDDELRVEFKFASSGWSVTDALTAMIRYGRVGHIASTASTASAAIDHLSLSASSSIDNNDTRALRGRLEISGLLNGANAGALIEARVAFSDTAPNQAAFWFTGGVREDVIDENIVGVRFYFVSGGVFTSGARLRLYGDDYPVA
jgi:hypothetical protein